MDLVISHPISWHLRRGGMGRVGGARRQALHRLRPRHRQRAGGGCSAEQWLPWSRAWTCCNGCCVTRGWLVVIEKSRLATASCAAHAGKAPMHCGSTWRGWHLGLKYGLGVQYGFKLETGWVKEEGEAGHGDYLYSHQYLNYWTPSPNWTWPIAWQRSHALRTEAASPNLSRDVLLLRPPLTGFKAYNL